MDRVPVLSELFDTSGRVGVHRKTVCRYRVITVYVEEAWHVTQNREDVGKSRVWMRRKA